MKEFYKDKVVLVTGGCGSIGSEIVKKLAGLGPKQIRILDISESGLHAIEQELGAHSNIRYLIGDIRDKDRIRFAMKDVNIVFNAAALKHVPFCEYNPFEAIRTNVIGTQNLVECAREEQIDNFISISTDKAVNPINTMGATKLLSEKIVLGGSIGKVRTRFCCIRFGNVLKSSGSVIPVFESQILNDKPLTLTSKDMTRFFMSINQAVGLVLHAGMISEGDEVFILKMPSLRIIDLAEALMEKHNKKADIKIIGKRPGEKTHEVLISEEEAEYIEELDDMYILRPSTGLWRKPLTKPSIAGNNIEYNSGTTRQLSKDQIRSMLDNL